MVKLQLDTNRDAVEDLQEAIDILQEAITRRQATEAVTQPAVAEAKPMEETAVETSFFKVTVESDEEDEPTLNELLESTDPITEDELTGMFKEHGSYPEEKEKKKPASEEEGDFIEIVELEEDQ